MTAPATPVRSDAVAYVIEPLHRSRNWMKFLAVLLFIAGALNALSVIGLIVAWIPVLVGVFLWQAATALEDGQQTSDVDRLRRATEKIRHLFMTYAVLAVAALIGFGLLVGLGFIAAIAEAF
ncbi:MAG: DUF5362 family protein [Acidimicrobiia bacterium]